MPVTAFILVALTFRFWTLSISRRHESSMKADGAREYGSKNSLALALCHISFYLSAIVEHVYRPATYGSLTVIGALLYGLSVISLLTVMRLLGRFWTVKLIVARDHGLIQHWLFRSVRHPNYFLNIIPELVGFALTLNAFITLGVGAVVYAFPLVARIRQEEAIMRETFTSY